MLALYSTQVLLFFLLRNDSFFLVNLHCLFLCTLPCFFFTIFQFLRRSDTHC